MRRSDGPPLAQRAAHSVRREQLLLPRVRAGGDERVADARALLEEVWLPDGQREDRAGSHRGVLEVRQQRDVLGLGRGSHGEAVGGGCVGGGDRARLGDAHRRREEELREDGKGPRVGRVQRPRVVDIGHASAHGARGRGDRGFRGGGFHREGRSQVRGLRAQELLRCEAMIFSSALFMFAEFGVTVVAEAEDVGIQLCLPRF
mmetsp:Transcript_83011/g.240168  ORF Transcript_83011/g.240168 Transcript_83011/m.240168 type:complete len:203 (-) Transcript_83011:135-743(-)